MREKLKRKQGITLIALVITIIILLILAGISISTLTGSGLFQKAGDTKNSYEEAERRENSILGEYENYIGSFGKNESNDEIIYFVVNGNPYSTVKGTTWRKYI